jgi:uncharacterized protein YjbJ (UPF0337 family)
LFVDDGRRPTARVTTTLGHRSGAIVEAYYEKDRQKMMKSSTKDQTEGKLHEVKGEIKEEVGKATNDPNLEVSGKAEKKAGKVQKWIGRAEKAVGE